MVVIVCEDEVAVNKPVNKMLHAIVNDAVYSISERVDVGHRRGFVEWRRFFTRISP